MSKFVNYTLDVYPLNTFSTTLKSHCFSHNRTVILQLKVRRPWRNEDNKALKKQFNGTASHYHGGWFYVFFDEGELAVGWNNKFVYYKDIVAVQWAGDQFSTRYFSWQCQSVIDNLKFAYNQKYRRWASPLRFLEDVFIPDEWEILCEAPSEFAEGFKQKKDITEHYSKIYLTSNPI